MFTPQKQAACALPGMLGFSQCVGTLLASEGRMSSVCKPFLCHQSRTSQGWNVATSTNLTCPLARDLSGDKRVSSAYVNK